MDVWLIADEVTALGYRLAGVTVETPAARDVAEILARARARAGLVLITAELALALPPGEREALSRAPVPPIVVIPDVRGREAVPDWRARWRRRLGVEA